jgi:PGF-CTERM protein
VDASDGTEQWAFETGDMVYSSPTVVDGTVYVGSNDYYLYAVDASDGTEQWAFETGDWVRSSPTVVDGTVYVGSDDYYLYAVEADVSGSSEGSRVLLGTLGHHDERADRQSGTIDDSPNSEETELGRDDVSPVSQQSETDDAGASETGETGETANRGDGSGPGFGIGGALAGLGGMGYLLKRRRSSDGTESS